MIAERGGLWSKIASVETSAGDYSSRSWLRPVSSSSTIRMTGSITLIGTIGNDGINSRSLLDCLRITFQDETSESTRQSEHQWEPEIMLSVGKPMTSSRVARAKVVIKHFVPRPRPPVGMFAGAAASPRRRSWSLLLSKIVIFLREEPRSLVQGRLANKR